MSWTEKAEKVFEEGAEKLLKNKELTSARLFTKLGLRFAKTVHVGTRPNGVASSEFIGSAASSTLTLIALVCHLGSKVLPLVNCEQFVPILIATSCSSGIFADQMAAYARNETLSLGDAAKSALE